MIQAASCELFLSSLGAIWDPGKNPIRDFTVFYVIEVFSHVSRRASKINFRKNIVMLYTVGKEILRGNNFSLQNWVWISIYWLFWDVLGLSPCHCRPLQACPDLYRPSLGLCRPPLGLWRPPPVLSIPHLGLYMLFHVPAGRVFCKPSRCVSTGYPQVSSRSLQAFPGLRQVYAGLLQASSRSQQGSCKVFAGLPSPLQVSPALCRPLQGSPGISRLSS